MGIPNKAFGYGNNSTAQNVFGVLAADASLSSKIKYECYDNDQTFPAVDTQTSNTNTIFIGTNDNNGKSMICLIDTTSEHPTSDWKPVEPVAGENNPNRMKGQTNYVEQDGAILTAGEYATFNMVIEIPSDLTTSASMGFDLLIRYTYTGNDPGITFVYNCLGYTSPSPGTDSVPHWVEMTPGTHGVKHCRAGSTYPSDMYANIPAEVGGASVMEDTAEGWALTAP